MGRSIHTVSPTRLRKRCVYMHMPKCGGTSVSEALYATVPLHQKIGILDSVSIRKAMGVLKADVNNDIAFHDEGDNADEIAAFREQLLVMHMCHNAQLIHGHFLFSEQAWKHFGKDYSYITILRDPVKRTISNYRFDKRIGHFFGDFDEYLESDHGRRQALHKLRYFSGMATVRPDQEAQAMALAKQNMARFALIGFMEDMDGFARDFGKIFGVKPRIAHYNGAGKQDAPLQMTESQRRRLEQLCAPDIELFEHSRRIAPGLMQQELKVIAA